MKTEFVVPLQRLSQEKDPLWHCLQIRGKTYRHVFTRAAEHMGISNLTGTRLKSVKQSAVSDHLFESNCYPAKQTHQVISIKTISLKIFNVHRHVVTNYSNWWRAHCNRRVSVFKHIYILLTCTIFSTSDDALLVRVKLQSYRKKHGLVNLICI